VVPLTVGQSAASPSGNGDRETIAIRSGGEPVHVMRKCVDQIPPLEQKKGEPGHVAACWFTE
jgi:hypothetical protein